MPQMRLGIVGAWLMAFVLAFGELGVSILVAPPGEATLPIRIYTIHRQRALLVGRNPGAAAGGHRPWAAGGAGWRPGASGSHR